MSTTLARPLSLPAPKQEWRAIDFSLVASVVIAHIGAVWLAFKAPATIDLPASPVPVSARLIAAAPLPSAAASPARHRPSTDSRPAPNTQPRPASVSTPSTTPNLADSAPADTATSVTPAANTADAGPAAPLPPATPALVSEGIEYLRAPAPQYPRAARSLGEEGRVLLKVLVDVGGQPREIEIAESSGYPRLDAAARTAIAQALFKPYRKGGLAQPMWARVPIHFQLKP